MAYSGNATPTTVADIAERMDTAEALLKRWLGCWIDLIALGLLWFLPAIAGVAVSAGLGLSDDSPVAALFILPGLLLAVVYFPVTESVWGRSLGKLVTGLVVVDADGKIPDIGRVFIRTLLRLIEVNPMLIGGLPAGIAVMVTRRKQRVGDLAAGTYVIPLKDLEALRRNAAPQTASLFD